MPAPRALSLTMPRRCGADRSGAGAGGGGRGESVCGDVGQRHERVRAAGSRGSPHEALAHDTQVMRALGEAGAAAYRELEFRRKMAVVLLTVTSSMKRKWPLLIWF